MRGIAELVAQQTEPNEEGKSALDLILEKLDEISSALGIVVTESPEVEEVKEVEEVSTDVEEDEEDDE